LSPRPAAIRALPDTAAPARINRLCVLRVDRKRLDNVERPVERAPAAAAVRALEHAIAVRACINDTRFAWVDDERLDLPSGDAFAHVAPAGAAVCALEDSLEEHPGVERGRVARVDRKRLGQPVEGGQRLPGASAVPALEDSSASPSCIDGMRAGRERKNGCD